MYIMCACLFSAFSRRLGALQISIIILLPLLVKTYVQYCVQVEWGPECSQVVNPWPFLRVFKLYLYVRLTTIKEQTKKSKILHCCINDS